MLHTFSGDGARRRGWVVGLRLAGTLAAVCLALGCRSRQSEGDRAVGPEVPVTLRDPANIAGFDTLRAESSPTSLVLHLSWRGRLPAVDETPAVGICLPPDLQPSARWREARIAGQSLRIGQPTDQAANGGGASSAEGPRTAGGKSAEPPELSPFAGTMQFMGYLRHWPIYRLTLAREVFEPLRRRMRSGDATGDASYELTLELSWSKSLPTTATAVVEPSPRSRESWLRVARSIVLNAGDLDRFAQPDPPWPDDLPKDDTDPRRLAPGVQRWARLRVGREGLVGLNLRELERVGFPIGQVRPEAVRVFSHGEPVPLLTAPGPGVPPELPPGVYLWVHGAQGRATNQRVYWVTLAPELPAARLLPTTHALTAAQSRPRATVPRTLVRDEDRTFRTRHGRFMAFLGMQWVEAALEPNRPILLGLKLPWMAANAGDTRLTLDFFIDRERSLQAARIEMGAGFRPREPLRFAGIDDTTRQMTLPADAFLDGATTISLLLAEGAPAPPPSMLNDEVEGSGVWFDRLELVYPSLPRLIDGRLTIPAEAASDGPAWIVVPDADQSPAMPLVALAVNRENEATALWPIGRDAQGQAGVAFVSRQGERLELIDAARLGEPPRLERVELDGLIAPREPCDLLIVTHEAFRKMADDLAAHRRSQGWAARVVDVQSVYDQFSNGEPDPPAIRALLAHALRRWPMGAPAQVLLVGDTTVDYLGEARNGVQSWVPSYTYTDGTDTFASDYWFATVTGRDALGDYMLGRLSVSNREDAQTVVDKLIAYDARPRPGPWRARMGYIADQGEFPAVLDELRREATPAAYGAERVFLNEYPLEDNWYLALQLVQSKEMKVSTRATADILKLFRKGVSFLSFYGHGSPNIWSNERMWFGGGSANSDNLMLAGSGVESFVANMTCNSGAIDYPLTPWNICITEDLMRVRDGGAIGCFVPSGPSVTLMHRRMSEALHQMLFERGLRGLGEVTAAAKAHYLLHGNPDELAYMYLLLGDPLTRLQMTSRRGTFAVQPDVAAPGGRLRMTLTGVTPPTGRWIGELTTDDNRRLWTGESQSYRDGRLTLDVVLPTTAPAGHAVLRAYCWSEGVQGEEQDVALAGDVRIETPTVALESFDLEPADDGGVRAVVTIANPTRLKGRGRLTIRLDSRGTSQTLLDETIEGAGRHPVPVPAGAQDPRESCLTAQLICERPPDDPSKPQTTLLRTAAWPSPERSVLLAPLCALDVDSRLRQGTLQVAASVSAELAAQLEQTGDQVVAGVDRPDGTTWLVEPLELKPWIQSGEVRDAATPAPKRAGGTLKLNMGAGDPFAGANLWLARRAKGAAGGRGDRLDTIGLDRIGRRRPRLSIELDSIRLHPASPMEGETVFIDCTVANQGNLMAPATMLRLLDSPTTAGAHLAPARMNGGTVRVPMLAPGRDATVTLRWDPVLNAGASRLWLQLMSETGFATGPAPGQYEAISILARTKPALAVGRTWADASDRDRRNNRVQLHAEVVNRGQSDAHQVVVAFYRSHVQVESNKLGEQLLETVPAENKAAAHWTWTFDPARDVVQGGRLPEPTIKIWIKGSVRPPISSPGTTEEE